MARLPEGVYAELDARLGPVDAELRQRYPGLARGRQPVHTVYVPAHRCHGALVEAWGTAARAALDQHGPLPYGDGLRERIVAKLTREPIEDLRIDFEDGYGVRPDPDEDAAARAVSRVVAGLRHGTPFLGIRIKCLEAPTRRRAIRTLDVFLDALGPPPDGFVITLPKVSAVEQVIAMTVLCGRLEDAYGLPSGRLRFEIQIETPPAVLGADGSATLARMIHAAEGRCAGLHYGTYDYSAACGIAGPYQSLDHPAADHAKAVMQVAAAGTGVHLSDGSTNVLPVGDTAAVRAAWARHGSLVRRSLERGFYQGWDLHPAQLPSRFAGTYAFFREGLAAARSRLAEYTRAMEPQAVAPEPPGGRSSGVLDEPATARALAGYLLRAMDCGAADPAEVGWTRADLEAL